jgi:hypothetical protein
MAAISLTGLMHNVRDVLALQFGLFGQENSMLPNQDRLYQDVCERISISTLFLRQHLPVPVGMMFL